MDPHVFHAEIEIVKNQQSSHQREQEKLATEIARLGQRDTAVPNLIRPVTVTAGGIQTPDS